MYDCTSALYIKVYLMSCQAVLRPPSRILQLLLD